MICEVAGARPTMRAASQACGVMVISARPALTAENILSAAWVAEAAEAATAEPTSNRWGVRRSEILHGRGDARARFTDYLTSHAGPIRVRLMRRWRRNVNHVAGT